MRTRPIRITLFVVGVIALLVGLLWIGQGLNLIHGSAMTGQVTWFYIGVVLAILGVVLLVLGLRRPGGTVHRRAQR